MKQLELFILVIVAITIVSCYSINDPGSEIEITKTAILDTEEPTEQPEADPSYLPEVVAAFELGLLHPDYFQEMLKLVEKYKDYKIYYDVPRMALRDMETVIDLTDRNGRFLPPLEIDRVKNAREVLLILERYSDGDSKFAQFARYRQAYRYLALQEIGKAIEIIKGSEWNDNEDPFHVRMRPIRLFDLVSTYCNSFLFFSGGEEAKEEAYKYYNELKTTYPGSDQAMMAKDCIRMMETLTIP